MPYTDLYQQQQTTRIRIPSILGVAIVAAVSFLVANFFLTTPQTTSATKKNIIQLETTNIGSSKASVVWRTTEKETGAVLLGEAENKLNTLVIDERDTASVRQKFFNHSVVLNNLKPSTTYFYSLTNGKQLLSINNSTVFIFRTAALDNRINSLRPAYGTVLSPVGTPEPDVLVIIKSANGVPLSSVSKSSGEWLVPLNSLIDAKTQTLLTPSVNDEIIINFFDEKGNTTTVNTPIELATPVETQLKMGTNYTLPEDAEVLGSVTTKKVATEPVFSLIYPISNTIIPVGSPLIKGTAQPLSIVSVVVQSLKGSTAPVSKLATTDEKGSWNVSLAKTLPAGTYRLIAKINNAPANTAITRDFTVTKSGESVLAEATGSGQISQSPSPTGQNSKGGATATATPTRSALPTTVAEPTDITPTLPATGGSVTYLVYSSAAFILLGLGLLVLF